MRRKKKHVVLRKMISVLLVFLLVTGILPIGMISPVYAATLPPTLGDRPLFMRDLPIAGGSTDPEDPVEPEDLVDTEGLTPPVTEGNGLESDETQAEQAAKLGLPTDQPSRISPSGKEVDKSQNPLGPDLLVTNRIYQLAYAYSGSQNVHSNPVNADGKVRTSTLIHDYAAADEISDTAESFNTLNRAVAAADVDGDGTQELVTVGVTMRVVNGKTITNDLKLFVEDYNNLKGSWNEKEATSSSLFTVAESIAYPGFVGYSNESLKIVAGDFDRDGKDEVAIAADKSIYVCEINMDDLMGFSFQILSSKTDYSAKIGDLEAKDANGDGFPELLAVEDGWQSVIGNLATITPATLHIYNGTDISSPVQSIPLSIGDVLSDGTIGKYDHLANASVDVGDIFGDGTKRIVIATQAGGGIALTYTSFDPKKETYNTNLIRTNLYPLSNKDTTNAEDKSEFGSVSSMTDAKCVYLTAPTPGAPVHVVVQGFIFKYNSTSNKFEQQRVTTSTEDSSGNVKTNEEAKSKGSITNVNERDDSDRTFIINTIVGNFDGNKDGKEQIIMLHYNKWYGKDIVYLTQCYVSSSGELKANLREDWRKSDDNAYEYPAICPIDYKNTGVTLKFKPDLSKFMFTNPIVSAVLAASPYYEELKDISAGLDQASTVYGTGTERTDSHSNGITANVGVSFGFEQGFSVLGVQIAQISFEAQVNNSFSYQWTSGKSIEKVSTWNNLFTDHAVVVTVIPQDVYYYTAYYKDESGVIHEEDMVVQIPYAPITTIKPVSVYNQAAADIPNAPIIGPEVLGGLTDSGAPNSITIGDPRTYPKTAEGLSNVANADVIMVGEDENSSFDGCGTGDSAGEQSITSTSFEEKEFNYELSYNASYNVAVFGVGVGINYGYGYTRSTVETNSEFTTRACVVSSVPSDYSQYEFQWAMAVYNYDLPAGEDSVQRCEVINYLVKPIGTYPPKMPANFGLDSQTSTENVLKWDAAEGAAGYIISRAETENGTAETDETFTTFTVTGIDTLTYSDTGIAKNTTYYYRIAAYDVDNSRESGPVSAGGLSVTGISVKTQPKLVYNEDDGLDLSALVVTLTTSNGTSYDVGFSNFGTDITTSLSNGVVLTTENSGFPMTVTYAAEDKSANTGNLTVNAKSPYDFTISVNFKLGTEDTTKLEANKTLQAVTQLTNTAASAQDVLVILALYSDKGNMEDVDYVTQNIASAQTQTVTPSLTLPGNITGYTAKVFVWDGTNLATTTLSPKSPTVKIPN